MLLGAPVLRWFDPNWPTSRDLICSSLRLIVLVKIYCFFASFFLLFFLLVVVTLSRIHPLRFLLLASWCLNFGVVLVIILFHLSILIPPLSPFSFSLPLLSFLVSSRYFLLLTS